MVKALQKSPLESVDRFPQNFDLFYSMVILGRVCSKLKNFTEEKNKKWANGQNIYDCENKIDLSSSFVPALGLYTYDHNSQTSLVVSQILGERLQDH